MNNEFLQYPIGKPNLVTEFTEDVKNKLIKVIAEYPHHLNELTKDFTAEQWAATYREDGWNAAQVVSHLADSHMHAYLNFKLGVMEVNPSLKSYNAADWAESADSLEVPPLASIILIAGLHAKWVTLLKSIPLEDFINKTAYRSATDTTVKISFFLEIYAWHANHHLAHLQIIKNETEAAKARMAEAKYGSEPQLSYLKEPVIREATLKQPMLKQPMLKQPPVNKPAAKEKIIKDHDLQQVVATQAAVKKPKTKVSPDAKIINLK